MKTKKDIVYVLKRCIEDNKAYNGFEYPKKGIVEAQDWKDTKEYGNGLHGWTLGFDEYFNGNLKGNFVVLEVDKKDGYFELDDKVKFKKGKIVLNTPNAEEAHAFMLSKYPTIRLHWLHQTAGNKSTQTAGSDSTQTAGSDSTQTAGSDSTQKAASDSTQKAGSYSTQTAGSYSTQTAGYESTQKAGSDSTQKAASYSTQKAGSYSTQTAGNRSTQTAGDRSTQTAGYESTQKAGSYSTQTAGNRSTQTAGDRSTQTAGNRSTQTAGNSSVMIQRFVSYKTSIIRFAENSVCILYTDDDIPHIYSKYKNETVYFYNGKPKKVYKHTDENIKKLEDWEVFVFGSNMNGNHAGGAAKLAQDKFGAENGNGEGLQGQSYAFPTLDKDMKLVSDDDFKASVEKLYRCAGKNTTKIFFLTKVGCGIANGDENKIKEFFKDAPANIIKPKGW